MLYDFDRWGRLGSSPGLGATRPLENRTFGNLLKLASEKHVKVPPVSGDRPEVKNWNLLALVDYGPARNGALRSNLRRFEASDSYSGLLSQGYTTRETASFTDGFSRVSKTSARRTCVSLLHPTLLPGRTSAPPLK